MSNPHGYELGFTIEQHRDELIERLGESLKVIASLQGERDRLNNVISAFTLSLEENEMSAFAQRVRDAHRAAIAQGGREQ